MTCLTARRANFPLIDALAQFVALTLAPEQLRFLALHAGRHVVAKTQWHWGSTLLRATTDESTATISAAQFDELVRAGLMVRRGLAGATITETGRKAISHEHSPN